MLNRSAYILALLCLLVAALSVHAVNARAASGPVQAQDTMHPLIMKQEGDRLAHQAPPAAGPRVQPKALQPVGGAGGPLREVFGFAFMNSGLSDPNTGYPSWNFSLLSTVAVFGIHVNNDGSLNSADVSTWQSSLVTSFINFAHSRGTKVVATVIMQDFSGGGSSAMCSALANRATTVTQIAQQVSVNAVDGLNVDYEGLNGTCSVNGQTARSMMTAFVQQLRSAMPSRYISVDTYGASAADAYNFFDIVAIANYADALMVMAYDQDWSNYAHQPLNCSKYCLSPVGALSGYYYNDTSEMAQYVASIPASKVLLGIPYYGRGACVPSASPNQYPTSNLWTPSYLFAGSMQSNSDNSHYAAGRDVYDSTERLDTWNSGTPSCIEEMYWDDAYSLGKKYDLVNQDNLRGIGIWALNYGGGKPELWDSLGSHFSCQVPAVSAYPGDGLATVAWAAVSNPQCRPVSGYQVTASPGGATITVSGRPPATMVAIRGLTNGTGYTFTVVPIVGGAFGVPSPPSAVVTPAAGAGPLAYQFHERTFVGTNADGRLEFFLRDGTGQVSHGWQTAAGGSWFCCAPLGLAVAGEPSVASNKDGRLEVFVRSTDGQIWHAWQVAPNGGWAGRSLGGQITAADPVAARNSDGRLEVFWIGPDNQLWHTWQLTPGGSWGAIETIGNGTWLGTPSVGLEADGRLDVFLRGSDGQLWHSVQISPGSGWAAYAAIGGNWPGDPKVATNADGRLELFMRGPDNQVWHAWEAAPGASSSWFCCFSLGTSVGAVGDPTAARNADGRLEVFWRGADNSLEHSWQVAPNSSWAASSSLGQSLAADPAVARNRDGRLEAFWTAPDGPLAHIWQTGANAGWSAGGPLSQGPWPAT
jgi:spore germination protein YaaH